MKKHLFALGAASVIALGAMSGSVFATDVTGEDGTADAVHTVGKSYIINIPGKINLSKSGNYATGTANVSASKVLLEVGETLTVSVRTLTGKLQASSGAVTSEIPYTIAINGGSAVNATTLAGDDKYSEIFTMAAGTTTQANTPLVLTTTSFDGVKLAAEHKDTLTFKVDVAAIPVSYMQDIDVTMKNSIASGTITSLVDQRDNNEYTVAKIGDDIWMTQNLSYAPEGATWIGGAMGSGIKTEGGETYYNIIASREVCPDGWVVPSKADFEALITGHDISWITGAPFNAVLTGEILNGNNEGNITGVGQYSSYWSSSLDGDNYPYSLSLSTVNGVRISEGGGPQGYSVRCVAE